MKFEKLSDTKIRITVTVQDLADKNIDFHVFMSNSIESQDILLDMLDEAKKQTGFDPGDSNLKIEALAMADSDFIFTITKIVPENKSVKRKFVAKRKEISLNSTQAIYSFNCFEDFCNFSQFLKDSCLIEDIKKIADSIILYTYKNKYYLMLTNICVEIACKLKFYANITEFAKHITTSSIFASKLEECGEILIKNNALEIGLTYFSNK